MSSGMAIPVAVSSGPISCALRSHMSQSVPTTSLAHSLKSPLPVKTLSGSPDVRYHNLKCRFFSKLNLLDGPSTPTSEERPDRDEPTLPDKGPPSVQQEAPTFAASMPASRLQFDESFSNFDAFSTFAKSSTSSGAAGGSEMDFASSGLSASAPTAITAQPIAIPSDLEILENDSGFESVPTHDDFIFAGSPLAEGSDSGEEERDSEQFVPPHLLVNRSAFSLDVRLPTKRMGRMADLHDRR